MSQYLWKNTITGKVIEYTHWCEPPKEPGTWVRVFAFGIGRVDGGGGTPSRVSPYGN